jgi:hypothetical protein
MQLLGFVPMHSDSQQFVRVAGWFETFTFVVRPFWQALISSATCPSTPSENNFSRCARRSGSRPLTNLQPFSKVEIGNAARSTGPMADRRCDRVQPLHCTLDRRRFDCEIPEVVTTGLPGNTRTSCDCIPEPNATKSRFDQKWCDRIHAAPQRPTITADETEAGKRVR